MRDPYGIPFSYGRSRRLPDPDLERTPCPELDVERLAKALDVDWSPAWHSIPIEEANGFQGGFSASWDKHELAELIARAYADLAHDEEP